MKKLIPISVMTLAFMTLLLSCNQNNSTHLFDGKTFAGWEGNQEVFRIEDGAIIGGSLNKRLKKTYYLNTEKKYSNFCLKLKVKILDQDSSANAGISFRASRIPNSTHVAAYQADLGYGKAKGMADFSDKTPKDMSRRYPLWGTLVDEYREDHFRYPKPELYPVVFLEVPERELIEKIVNFGDWNDVSILAEGNKIQIKINGVQTVNFTETANVSKDGYICLQAHGGAPFEVHYKDLVIEEIKN